MLELFNLHLTDSKIDTKSGSPSAAVFLIEKFISSLKIVFSGFTSISVALLFLAYKNKELAGDTANEVPTIIMISQVVECITASFHTSCFIPSPNHTTSGRRELPHNSQIGGISMNSYSILPLKLHFAHLVVKMFPWSSVTSLLPARWCNPSMFWETTDTCRWFWRFAIAVCPGFGFAAYIFLRLSLYQLHTNLGSSMKAWGEASFIAEKDIAAWDPSVACVILSLRILPVFYIYHFPFP